MPSTNDATQDRLKPVRATWDVIGGDRDKNGEFVPDMIPPERFGREKARILRKAVLIAIAKNADKDGANSYPSLQTIALRCLVSERAVGATIKWLKDHGLLKVDPYAGVHHTNRYTILFPEKREVNLEIELPSSNPEIELPGELEKVEGNPEEWSGQPGRMEAQPGNRTSDDLPLDRPFLTSPLRSVRKERSHSRRGVSSPSSAG